jgi:hypothetical protein
MKMIRRSIMRKKIAALTIGILLGISMVMPVMAASSPNAGTVTRSVTAPVTAGKSSGYNLSDSEKLLTATTPLEAAMLAGGFIFDSGMVGGNPIALISAASDPAFIANVKAALLKDASVRATIAQYGAGTDGVYNLDKGSVLSGAQYVGDAQVTISLPGVPEGYNVVLMVYRLGSKTPTIVKPTKLKNGKYVATLPLPCSWYAVTGK